MTKAIAVLISDIHFNIHTLEVANAALKQAVEKANVLDAPLVIAGDLHDTKATLRAECVNAILETLSHCRLEPIVLIGNHDKINEKSEEHSLNFINTYFKVTKLRQLELPEGDRIWVAGYYSDPMQFQEDLKKVPKNQILIMHQGVQGSLMGDYVIDKSALPKEVFADLRVISGHYHPRQTIRCPGRGSVSYVGNPYTLGFGEANDPEKGFQVLYSDGSLEFVPTELRKHIKFEVMVDDLDPDKTSFFLTEYKPGDLLWVVVKGHKEYLNRIEREDVLLALELPKDTEFRLDLVPTDETAAPEKADTMDQPSLMDAMIDAGSYSPEQKSRLKELWRTCASN